MKQVIGDLTYVNDYWVILLPAILMAIDVLTGLIGAWSKKEIKSSVMRQGLAKKFGEIVVLALGQLLFYSVSLPSVIVTGLSFYVVLMELISVCENLQKLGVPIPEFIKNALKDAENKYEKKGGRNDDAESEDS